jgi:hypothetical protein
MDWIAATIHADFREYLSKPPNPKHQYIRLPVPELLVPELKFKPVQQSGVPATLGCTWGMQCPECVLWLEAFLSPKLARISSGLTAALKRQPSNDITA